MDDEEFRKAARQLGESGAFNDIAYSLLYSSAGTRLVFQVTDADKFVPVHFNDFVWFTDQELLQKVHERAPLQRRIAAQDACPIKSPTFCRPCWWKTASRVMSNTCGLRSRRRSTGVDRLWGCERYHSAPPRRVHRCGNQRIAATPGCGRKAFRTRILPGAVEGFVEHTVLPVYHERGYLKASGTPHSRRSSRKLGGH